MNDELTFRHMTPAEQLEAAEAMEKAAMARAEKLRRIEAERVNAVEIRAAAEKGAAKQIKTMEGELQASAVQLTAAAEDAQRALTFLLDTATAHDGLVAAHSAALTELGLSLEDGADHQTGGSRRTGLRLKGVIWRRVEAGTLGAWIVHRAALARVGNVNPLATTTATAARAFEKQRGDLLANVTDPDEVAHDGYRRMVAEAFSQR